MVDASLDAAASDEIERPVDSTAALVLADGTAFWGHGIGAAGQAVGEVCFNTSITGYQEILTDPSYAGQIITFTFPHIGNVGANPEDVEPIIQILTKSTLFNHVWNITVSGSNDSHIHPHRMILAHRREGVLLRGSPCA